MMQMMIQMQSNMMEVLRSVADPSKNNELISYMREKDELDRRRQDERDNRILDTLQQLASNRNDQSNQNSSCDSNTSNAAHIRKSKKEPELPSFHGDPKDWKVFEELWEDCVEKPVIYSPVEKHAKLLAAVGKIYPHLGS